LAILARYAETFHRLVHGNRFIKFHQKISFDDFRVP